MYCRNMCIGSHGFVLLMLVHSQKHINEVDRGVEAAEQLGEVLIHAHPVVEDAI